MNEEEKSLSQILTQLHDIHMELYRIRTAMKNTTINYVTLVIAVTALVASILH